MTDIIKAQKDKPIFNKYKLLLLSILFDIIGLASYIIPGAGEIVDLFWAPLSAILLYRMYPGNIGKVASIIGFIEEAIPGLDFIPTFTITWIYSFLICNTK